MAFIITAELKTVGVPEVVQKAINEQDDIVLDIIDETEDVMRSYLSGRFDVDAIFSAVAGNRSGVVVKHFKKVVIDEIYKRKTNGLNEVTQLGYDEAMTWLTDVANGKIAAGDLPPKEDEPVAGDGFIKYGGNTRYDSDF